MFTLPFVIVATGLLVAGYALVFSGTPFARASGVWAVAVAGFIVGGLVTAHLNGGKPYGFDVPFGVERWKQELPPAAPPVRTEQEPAIAWLPSWDTDQRARRLAAGAKGFAARA